MEAVPIGEMSNFDTDDLIKILEFLEIVSRDSTVELNAIVNRAQENNIEFSLLFTSPPYYDVTDYHTDQWLRLWLLGGPEVPEYNKDKHKGRFSSKVTYTELLDSVFGQCSQMMSEQSTVYVRLIKETLHLKQPHI